MRLKENVKVPGRYSFALGGYVRTPIYIKMGNHVVSSVQKFLHQYFGDFLVYVNLIWYSYGIGVWI